MISYCTIWFYIAFYEEILRVMILCNLKSKDAFFFQMADSISTHIAQYEIIAQNIIPQDAV